MRGDVRERDNIENLGVEGRVFFKHISKDWGWRNGLNRSGSGKGRIGDSVSVVMHHRFS